MGLRPVIQCPQCKGTMRAHCSGWRCGWAFCGICAITYDVKTKRITHKGY